MGISIKWSSGNENVEDWWLWRVDDKSWVGSWSRRSELPRKSNVRAEISSGRTGSDEANIAGGEGWSDVENAPDPEPNSSDDGGDI